MLFNALMALLMSVPSVADYHLDHFAAWYQHYNCFAAVYSNQNIRLTTAG